MFLLFLHDLSKIIIFFKNFFNAWPNCIFFIYNVLKRSPFTEFTPIKFSKKKVLGWLRLQNAFSQELFSHISLTIICTCLRIIVSKFRIFTDILRSHIWNNAFRLFTFFSKLFLLQKVNGLMVTGMLFNLHWANIRQNYQLCGRFLLPFSSYYH